MRAPAILVLVWAVGVVTPRCGVADESFDAAAAPVAAGGGVLVAPTRLVFEGRTRTAQVTVVNRGATQALYRIALVRMRMNANGALEYVSTPLPGESFADTLVQFSPRQLLLDPGTPQTIRLLLRLPADLPDGEYRSHLQIREVPMEAVAVDHAGADSVAGGGWEVRLRPLVGAAIPVIVRHGALTASLSASDLQLLPGLAHDEPSRLALRLHRSGGRSVYGDAIVTYVPPAGGARVIGTMYGLAVYTPDSTRSIRIPLEQAPVAGLKAGRLEVEFRESARTNAQRATAGLELP